MAKGMGFWRVQRIVPWPIPIIPLVETHMGYPYPCTSLGPERWPENTTVNLAEELPSLRALIRTQRACAIAAGINPEAIDIMEEGGLLAWSYPLGLHRQPIWTHLFLCQYSPQSPSNQPSTMYVQCPCQPTQQLTPEPHVFITSTCYSQPLWFLSGRFTVPAAVPICMRLSCQLAISMLSTPNRSFLAGTSSSPDLGLPGSQSKPRSGSSSTSPLVHWGLLAIPGDATEISTTPANSPNVSIIVLQGQLPVSLHRRFFVILHWWWVCWYGRWPCVPSNMLNLFCSGSQHWQTTAPRPTCLDTDHQMYDDIGSVHVAVRRAQKTKTMTRMSAMWPRRHSEQMEHLMDLVVPIVVLYEIVLCRLSCLHNKYRVGTRTGWRNFEKDNIGGKDNGQEVLRLAVGNRQLQGRPSCHQSKDTWFWIQAR